jgi:hypothetical protein
MRLLYQITGLLCMVLWYQGLIVGCWDKKKAPRLEGLGEDV